jgi:hypothetical protein
MQREGKTKISPGRVAAYLLAAASGCLVLAALALLVAALLPGPDDRPDTRATRPPIPFAVLGDSDSKSYQEDPEKHGGSFLPTTFAWPEVIARLRGDTFDPGAWAKWGTRSPYQKIRDYLGMPSRMPRKTDYRYNFAFIGATCKTLMIGERRQAPRLVELMNREPERWRDGVVVIRIGINSVGDGGSLAALARDPRAPQVMQATSECVGYIRAAVNLIRASHPTTRLVLVGIFNDSFWESHSPQELDNISSGLDHFDDALKALAASQRQCLFHDDRAWFSSTWGMRGADGQFTHPDVVIGHGFHVHGTVGDHPSNAILADGHAGAVWNALWAQRLVRALNERFGLHVPDIREDEIARLLDPHGTYGMSASQP